MPLKPLRRCPVCRYLIDSQLYYETHYECRFGVAHPPRPDTQRLTLARFDEDGQPLA